MTGEWSSEFLTGTNGGVNVSPDQPGQLGGSEQEAKSNTSMHKLKNQQNNFEENNGLGLVAIQIFLPSGWGHHHCDSEHTAEISNENHISSMAQLCIAIAIFCQV